MINLLSGEFYKLRKSRCAFVCCIIVIAFLLFECFTYQVVDQMEQGEAENGSYGGVVIEEASEEEYESYESVWEQVSVLDIASDAYGIIGTILIAVFAAIFVTGEYANGAIKNIVGKGYNRWQIFSAKYLMTIIASFLLMIYITVFILIIYGIFGGFGSFSQETWKSLCIYVLMQSLFMAALTGIFVSINQVCRNLGAGIAINIGIIVFSAFITSGLDLFLNYLKINFKLKNWWILSLMEICPTTGIESSFVIRTIISVSVSLLLSFILGNWHFKKTDIK